MNDLLWFPLDYVRCPIADLVFGSTWYAGDYMISPVMSPEDISQVWSVEHGTAEIGRYETIQAARTAAEDHMKVLE